VRSQVNYLFVQVGDESKKNNRPLVIEKDENGEIISVTRFYKGKGKIPDGMGHLAIRQKVRKSRKF